MFGDGFDYQKGAIFGFGPSAAADTGKITKISNLDTETLEKMDANVLVHNVLEERNMGCIGYGLVIRGNKNLNYVSRKHVLNRSSDLLEREDSSEFKKFRHKAASIKEIRLDWNNKM